MHQPTLEGFRAPETGTSRRPAPVHQPRPLSLSLRVAEAPALADREPVSSSVEAVEAIRATIGNADRECFVILHLDVKNQVLAAELHSIGDIDAAAVYPRQVLKSALLHNASALIFGHNHPSGDPEPSLCDREITRQLVFAAHVLGIKVLDHVITGPLARYFSFADQCLIDEYAQAAASSGIAEAGQIAEPSAREAAADRAAYYKAREKARNARRHALDKAAGQRARLAYEAQAWARRAIREEPRPYVLEPAEPLRVASRTFHTTPAFPRTLRGPRGGHVIAPTPCSECVAFDCCRPGACTAPWGCDSWVDLEGRRVDVEADNARLLAQADDYAPEGMTPAEFAALSPEDQETARAIDDLTRLPDDDLVPDAGPLFQR